jgi:hypothetical protein
MPIVATVLVGEAHVRIFCLDLRRDPIVPSNVQLVACRSLAVEDEEGGEFDTDLWSIPTSSLVSYAVGNRAAPVVADTEQAPAKPLLADLTDEQREAVRRRREELREIDRQQLAELRAKAKQTVMNADVAPADCDDLAPSEPMDATATVPDAEQHPAVTDAEPRRRSRRDRKRVESAEA